MYSLKILQSHLDRIHADTGRRLQFHSIPSSTQWTQHLDSIYDYEKKGLIRDLTPEEKDFISNELTLSKLHAPYWLERYAKIKPSSGRVTQLKPNFSQQVLLGIISEMEEKNMPIMLQMLKLRQLGVSTIWQLLIAHRVLFYLNVDALVGSNDPDKTLKLLDQYAGFCYRNLPWWMCREVDDGGDLVIKRSGEVYAQFLNNNSAISWQHGTQTSGMARGGNPQLAHLTELPDYADPKLLVEGSLMNAVHEDSFTLFGLESTAAGEDDWWHTFWKANEKLYGKGVARFRPIFLPWYLGKDVWPPSGWVKDRQERGILRDYRPSELSIAHAERARRYVLSKDYLYKVLGLDWKMPIEQMAYWEFSREFAIEMKSEHIWLQEVGAADADECFQSGGSSLFDFELLQHYHNSLPLLDSAWIIDCEEIQQKLRLISPSERLPQPRVLPFSIEGQKSTLTTALREVSLSTYPECDSTGKFLVWEPPLAGYTYTISYDGAGGKGQGDNVAIEVLRHATPFERAKQVAEWRANNYTYHNAWPVLLTIALFYSSQLPKDEQCEIAIELRSNGSEVQDELSRRGWRKFYRRYSYKGKERNFEGYGWQTSVATRPKLIDTLIAAVSDMWFDISSPWLLGEIKRLGKFISGNKVKIEASPGSRDDLAIAIAIALVTSLGDVAPTSQDSVVKKLLLNLKERSRNQSITPSQAQQGKSLLSFNSKAIIAPSLEEILNIKKESNLWN